jgi:hypothetical protein
VKRRMISFIQDLDLHSTAIHSILAGKSFFSGSIVTT